MENFEDWVTTEAMKEQGIKFKDMSELDLHYMLAETEMLYGEGEKDAKRGVPKKNYSEIISRFSTDANNFLRWFYYAYSKGYEDARTDMEKAQQEAIYAAIAAYPRQHSLYEKAKQIDVQTYGTTAYMFYYLSMRFNGDIYSMFGAAFRVGFLKGQRCEKARQAKQRKKSVKGSV